MFAIGYPAATVHFAATSEQGEEGEGKKEAAVSILKGQIQIAPAYNLSRNNLGGGRT